MNDIICEKKNRRKKNKFLFCLDFKYCTKNKDIRQVQNHHRNPIQVLQKKIMLEIFLSMYVFYLHVDQHFSKDYQMDLFHIFQTLVLMKDSI
jgi:hypothetical protein